MKSRQKSMYVPRKSSWTSNIRNREFWWSSMISWVKKHQTCIISKYFWKSDLEFVPYWNLWHYCRFIMIINAGENLWIQNLILRSPTIYTENDQRIPVKVRSKKSSTVFFSIHIVKCTLYRADLCKWVYYSFIWTKFNGVLGNCVLTESVTVPLLSLDSL